MMTGRRFPRGLGHDFSGVIEAVGKNVTRFKVGDEVFGAMGLKEAGSFAEALVTDEKLVFPKPPSISFEATAALPVVSATAWFALIEQAKLQAGQRVFINGCLGGVGRPAVQMARMRGAEVTGSCSAARRDEALALGVQEVIDYRAFDGSTYRNRFDVVFDTQGSLSPREGATMLKPGGLVLDIVPTPLKMIRSRVLVPVPDGDLPRSRLRSWRASQQRSSRVRSRLPSDEPCHSQKSSRPLSSWNTPARLWASWLWPRWKANLSTRIPTVCLIYL